MWGGTTYKGIDCSGFTSSVFKRNGISIKRTANLQYYQGEQVSKSRLKTGDLVFFTTYKKGPSHVGIYLGKNRFIHSSSAKGKVTISNFGKRYYAKRYIGAKRMIVY